MGKLNASGSSLEYAAFLGGAEDDSAHAIALDRSGNVYVAGSTKSRDFPAVNALQPGYAGGTDVGDGFVAKIDTTQSGTRTLFCQTPTSSPGDGSPTTGGASGAGNKSSGGCQAAPFDLSTWIALPLLLGAMLKARRRVFPGQHRGQSSAIATGFARRR